VNWLQIVLRFVHIVSGATWVGMMALSTFFVGPALADAGPEGGKVMAGLQKRGLMTVMPALAVLTLISGFWLFLRFTNGQPGVMRSATGMAFGLGGIAALLSFVIGIVYVRPAMMKAASKKEESAQIHARVNAVSRWVARLLFFALGAMAVARYL
jgi:uncharacterized membrane protein